MSSSRVLRSLNISMWTVNTTVLTVVPTVLGAILLGNSVETSALNAGVGGAVLGYILGSILPSHLSPSFLPPRHANYVDNLLTLIAMYLFTIPALLAVNLLSSSVFMVFSLQQLRSNVVGNVVFTAGLMLVGRLWDRYVNPLVADNEDHPANINMSLG